MIVEIIIAVVVISLLFGIVTLLSKLNARISLMFLDQKNVNEQQAKINQTQVDVNHAIKDYCDAQKKMNEGLSFFLVRNRRSKKSDS